MPGLRWRYIAGTAALVLAALLILASPWADLPDPRNAPGRQAAASILITDRAGRLLYEIIDPNGNKHIPLPLSAIPLACRQATLATEDSRFYSHHGVDLLAILRTAWQNRTNLAAMPGASTLTQQLARNLYLAPEERVERSLRRKLREAWLAWRLEQRYSKDELLALYLNTTYYGHFAVGIEAAARAYFGVGARELDLAQCALLAGLPQYPAGYNPIENPQAARYRQRVVLDLMVKDGYITAAQADEAYGERLAYASTPFPIEAPHFVMWVQAQLEELLGAERLRAGGLRVVTTLDLDWQHVAEEAIRRRLAQLRPCTAGRQPGISCDPAAEPGRRVENAALVALDPATGAVLAMVGSPDYFAPAISGATNAALSPRQPGSAIKPLTYALALDPARAAAAGQTPWTAATLIADVRTVFITAEGEPYVPHNYDLAFHGPVTVRTALANSYNVPAVKALEYVGVEALVELAGRMGIAWDNDARYWGLGIGDQGTDSQNTQSLIPHFGLALTLGGGEVRLLDLTAAYAAFANGGQRITPYGIARIETLDGEVIADRLSLIADRLSLIADRLSPIADRGSLIADRLSRIADRASPGADRGSSIADRVSPIADRVSPIADRVSPIADRVSSIADRVSPIADRESLIADDDMQYETRNTQYPIPNTQSPLDPRVAYLITDILSDEVARLPAFGAGNVLAIGRPAAVKTGTTTDWRDNWTLGYTPDLVAGVWVGNADNTPMQGVSGVSGAGPIWHDFMTTVLRDTPPRSFPRPDGLVRVEVCADSGLLPGRESPIADRESLIAYRLSPVADNDTRYAISDTRYAISDTRYAISDTRYAIAPCPYRRYEWFIAGTEPTQVDEMHRRIAIDVRTGALADAATPPEYINTQTIWVLPEEYRDWARENHIPQPPAIGHQLSAINHPPPAIGHQLSAVSRQPSAVSLQVTSPDPNRIYRLDPGLPAAAQRVPVTVRPGPGLAADAAVTLLLNGVPFATVTAPDYTIWWQLTRGRHVWQAVATGPDGTQVASQQVVLEAE